MPEDTTAADLAALPQADFGSLATDSGAAPEPDLGAPESGGASENLGDILSEFENRGLSAANPEPGAPPAKPAKDANPPENQPAPPAPVRQRWDQRTAETAQARATQLAAVTDPAAKTLLTRMSNEGFAHFYPLQLQLQNGELIKKADHERAINEAKASAPPASFVDHERGYMLTPEYETAATEYQQLAGAADFWTEQIAAVDAGQPFRVLQKGADGKPVISQQTYDPKQHPGARAQMEAQRSSAQHKALMLEQRLEQFPEQHKANVAKAAGVFTTLSQTMFGSMAPKFAEMAKEVVIKHFPPHMHSSPQTLFTAQMIVAGELAAKQIRALNTELAKYKKVAGAASRGLPPVDDTGGAPESADDDNAAVQAIDNIVARRGR